MKAEQLQALARGRQRQQAERRRESIRRVDAFKRWLKHGSKLRDIPEIPSDHDYELWRQREAGRKSHVCPWGGPHDHDHGCPDDA